ncbi:galactoside alpha-(1,2)-fucosyltransferase 2-like [Liolophura sinensis]|uniref:galactoside alpha-(1,2)-fucosyltransferase 2-like n=1 Tax=Liolophura sinensis TaxID=3198878 RepID=UPI003159414A
MRADRQKDEKTKVQRNGQTSTRMDGLTDERADRQKERRRDQLTDGERDGWRDGQTDRERDGQRNGQSDFTETFQNSCSCLKEIQRTNSGKFLCKILVGGLGNHMFQYASLYGIARSKGMIPLIDARDVINDVFETWALKRSDRNKSVCFGMPNYSEKRSSAFDNATVTFQSDQHTHLYGYLQSFLYFATYEQELRCQFKFSYDVTKRAEELLSRHLKSLRIANAQAVTLVAVHVRRGDKLSAAVKSVGGTVAPKEYILKAKQYFIKKYGRVVFVVCSDSIDWCTENIPGENTVFVRGQSAVEDLAVMSLCQHAIMTVGTFGWWMAWLVNGDTVYYSRRFLPGSRLSQQWNLSHHYPSHWIPME